ncbi:MAG: hypothetical protein ACFB21_08525 [Opitutales bacterium]
MTPLLLKYFVHARFATQTRGQITRQIKRTARRYATLSAQMTPEAGERPIHVPELPGVDEDMRRWSFFQLLEHNTIVNRTITLTIKLLVENKPLDRLKSFDTKRDVMPPAAPGPETIDAFQLSVEKHVAMVSMRETLSMVRKYRHPLFGMFNAHKWNCMFAFHLDIHLRQADRIAAGARQAEA